MILHIATFNWRENVTTDAVEALTVALTAMADGIPELRSYVCGPGLGIRPGADYGVAAIVDDAAALEAYLNSPLHLEVYQQHLGEMIAERSAVQLPLSNGSLS
jgi:hypothetical protein